MLEVNVPQEYVARAQQIVGSVSYEVKSGYDFRNMLRTLWQDALSGTESKLNVDVVTFGDQGNTISNIPNASLLNIENTLEMENTALMVSNDKGAVFCLSHVKVGDKQYLQFLNPQTAMAIRDEQAALLRGVEKPEMSFWDKVCEFFAQLFRDHPTEAAARNQAYRDFYENMQKNVSRISTLTETEAARRFDQNRPAPAQNQPAEEAPQVEVAQQPAVSVEEVPVVDEAQMAKNNRIKELEQTIKECQDRLAVLQPRYDEATRIVKERAKEVRRLQKLEETAPQEKTRIEEALERAEEKMAELDEQIEANRKKQDFDDRKNAFKRRLDNEKNSLDKLRADLEEAESVKKGAELEFQLVSGEARESGAWNTPQEYLANQYAREKKISDLVFEKEQQGRNERMEEQRRVVEIYENQIKAFTGKLGFFKRNKEEDMQLEGMRQDLENAKQQYSEMQEQDLLAQKKHEEQDEARRKELLEPTEERVQETAEQLKKLRAHHLDVKNRYNEATSRFNSLQRTLYDRENSYNISRSQYDARYVKNPDRYDPELHERLMKEKADLEQNVKKLQEALKQNNLVSEKLPKLLKDLMNARVDGYEKQEGIAKEMRQMNRILEKAQDDLQREYNPNWQREEEKEKDDESFYMGF